MPELSATYTYSGIEPVQASASTSNLNDVGVDDITTDARITDTINEGSSGVCRRFEFEAHGEWIADIGSVHQPSSCSFVWANPFDVDFPGLGSCIPGGADATWLNEYIIGSLNNLPIELAWSTDGASWTTRIGGNGSGLGDFNAVATPLSAPYWLVEFPFPEMTNIRYVRIRLHWYLRYYDDIVDGYLAALLSDFRVWGSGCFEYTASQQKWTSAQSDPGETSTETEEITDVAVDDATTGESFTGPGSAHTSINLAAIIDFGTPTTVNKWRFRSQVAGSAGTYLRQRWNGSSWSNIGFSAANPEGIVETTTSDFTATKFRLLLNASSSAVSPNTIELTDFRLYNGVDLLVCSDGGCDPPTEAPVLMGETECCGKTHRLEWTEIDNATSYNVYRNGILFAEGVTELEYEATGQDAGAVVAWTVQASNDCGEGPASEGVELGPYFERGDTPSCDFDRSAGCSTSFGRSAGCSSVFTRRSC